MTFSCGLPVRNVRIMFAEDWSISKRQTIKVLFRSTHCSMRREI